MLLSSILLVVGLGVGLPKPRENENIEAQNGREPQRRLKPVFNIFLKLQKNQIHFSYVDFPNTKCVF